jgi:hemolysin activation/secretion protein
LILKLDGQFAGETLVASEQMSIGGPDSVRGYPPFEYMADQGMLASVELRAGLPFLRGSEIFERLQATVFVDFGWGSLIQVGAGEDKEENLYGAGFGVRFPAGNWLMLRLDVAWPFSSREPNNGQVPALYVSVRIRVN